MTAHFRDAKQAVWLEDWLCRPIELYIWHSPHAPHLGESDRPPMPHTKGLESPALGAITL